MSQTKSRTVEESLLQIKHDVEACLGVDVADVELEHTGSVIVKIANIDPAVWECCPDPTFGVSRATPIQVSVIDGREDVRLPTYHIEIEFGKLFQGTPNRSF